MRTRIALMIVIFTCLAGTLAAAPPPAETIASAQTVLNEALTTQGAQIPAALLRDSYGVAIIPSVLKVGFIGGVRRGHGVVVIKDKDGNWTAPQFVTITGGSIGWQIGAQSTDVILVFNSQRSVEGMLKGKFTIGADAAAAAGPVGRNLAAATDAQLKAEILSYSRSRGLFAGVSIDGSALEINPEAATQYYAARPGEAAAVPEGATKLVQQIAAAADSAAKEEAAVVPAVPAEVAPRGDNVDALRGELATSATALQGLLKPEWQRYLALPAEVYGGRQHASADALAISLGNFEQVAKSRDYASLNQRPEFQKTIELLRAYRAAVAAAPQQPLDLPPPPGRR